MRSVLEGRVFFFDELRVREERAREERSVGARSLFM